VTRVASVTLQSRAGTEERQKGDEKKAMKKRRTKVRRFFSEH
jgi:hypothetical protein